MRRRRSTAPARFMSPCLRAALAAALGDDPGPDNAAYRTLGDALSAWEPSPPRASRPVLGQAMEPRWLALSAPAALGVWLAGFAAWAFAASGDHAAPALARGRLDALSGRDPHVWALDAWILRVVARSVLAVARLGPMDCSMAHGLKDLRAFALRRLRPATARAALFANPGLEVGFWLSGWMLLLAESRLQHLGGPRSQAHARARMACMPTDLAQRRRVSWRRGLPPSSWASLGPVRSRRGRCTSSPVPGARMWA